MDQENLKRFTQSMDNFRTAEDIDQIVDIFQTILSVTNIDPDSGIDTYHQLMNHANGINWWKEFQNKINEKLKDKDESLKPEYNSQNVVIVGAGPGGLVSALECALMGAKVHVIEKRTYLSRNNILHIWQFTVTYLTSVGAKIFYPKFAVGGMDHIGTKQIQRLLIKICLLLGVRFHFGHTFTELYTEEGKNEILTRCDPPIGPTPCSLLIGADGVSSTVAKRYDFHRSSLSSSLCIGITFNLQNKNTPEELAMREFAVAQFYKQSMFKEIQDRHNIALENLVYYQGETHYFVMTIKKNSLCDRGVFKEMKSNISELLDPANINDDKLLSVARDTATFCGLPESCEFMTFQDKTDVQIFDFSERIQADESIKLVEISKDELIKEESGNEQGSGGGVNPQKTTIKSNNGELPKVIVTLVGDALLEPFWPLGTGANRAILSALDAAWIVQETATKRPTDEILRTRQGCYIKMKTALAETFTAPDKVCLNPYTRYTTRKLEKDI